MGTAPIVVDTSTLALTTKEAARSRLADCEITLLDCPVSGTGGQARHRDIVGTLAACSSGFTPSPPPLLDAVSDLFARAAAAGRGRDELAAVHAMYLETE